MITVEFTLIYNHVVSVLGPQGRIYFPSQLIPMIIGAFTLTRLLYKKLEKVRGGIDVDPTVIRVATIDGSPQPMPSRRSILKLFAPPTSQVQPGTNHVPEDEDIDPQMDGKPAWTRYLVAYLPWLSLLPNLQRRTTQRTGSDPHDQQLGGSSDIEARGRSDVETLQGLPDAAANREKYDPLTGDGIDRDAVSRSWGRTRISTGGLMGEKQKPPT